MFRQEDSGEGDLERSVDISRAECPAEASVSDGLADASDCVAFVGHMCQGSYSRTLVHKSIAGSSDV